MLKVVAIGLGLALSGCSTVAYYGQAITGHWRVLSLRRSVEAAMNDPASSPNLQQRLALAQKLRDFATQELALPDNKSYRSYANLQRPYLVQTVFATPPLSLELRQWCFPIAGCVSYRGFFKATAAQRFADRLRARGDDVYVAHVPAYSTLGWFDDPLLNTFIHWPVGQLAELIFHELAHQRLYIPGDTDFNESFASAVGYLGAQRWLEHHGTLEQQKTYAIYKHFQNAFVGLIAETRNALAVVYNSGQSDEEKQVLKQQLLATLQNRYEDLKAHWDGYSGYDRWFAEGLDNAKLASVSTYTHWIPAFQTIFANVGEDFAAFYEAAAQIGRRPPTERTAYLEQLLAATDSAVQSSATEEVTVLE